MEKWYNCQAKKVVAVAHTAEYRSNLQFIDS